jgi:hypothetical protein
VQQSGLPQRRTDSVFQTQNYNRWKSDVLGWSWHSGSQLAVPTPAHGQVIRRAVLNPAGRTQKGTAAGFGGDLS